MTDQGRAPRHRSEQPELTGRHGPTTDDAAQQSNGRHGRSGHTDDLFARLPRDVLSYLLQECDDAARCVVSLSCCSSTLQPLVSDSALWGALLRRRHRALFGDSADPHQTLLPSVARAPVEASPPKSPHRGGQESSPKPRWPALYQVCEREWLEALAEPSSGAPWTIWLAWQRRYAPEAGHARWSLALHVALFLAPELESRAAASTRSTGGSSQVALRVIALMSCVVVLFAWLHRAMAPSVF